MRISNPAAGWNALMVSSIVVLVAAFGLYAFMPAPRPKLNVRQRSNELAKVRNETKDLEARTKANEALIAKYVWAGDAKLAEAEAMALVTKAARAHEVGLGAFRPQRTIEGAGLRRLPFAVSLEGPYLQVMAFLRDLETPGNRLAVQLVQMSASDGSSSHVAATLSIIAFQALEEEKKTHAKAPAAVPAVPAAEGADRGPKTSVSAFPTGRTETSPRKKSESAASNLNKASAGASVHQ